jgi:CHAT domain-containing protein
VLALQAPARLSLHPVAPSREFRSVLRLEAGMLVRIVAEQRGADAELWLYGPDGALLQYADRPNRDRGDELLYAVTRRAGDHELRVQLTLKEPGGSAELRIESPRPPSEREARVVELYGELQAERWTLLAERLEQLATGFERLGEPLLQAEALLHAGFGNAHPDGNAREEPLARAVELFRCQGALVWQGVARRPLAGLLLNQGRSEEARVQAERMQTIAARLGWPWLHRYAMRHLGQAYYQLGQYQRALESFAAVLEGEGDRCEDPRSDAWHHVALVQARIFHRGDRALPLFQQALACFAADSDAERQSTVTGQIGRVYVDQERLAEAEAQFAHALDVHPGLSACERAKLLARRAEVARLRGDRARALELAEEAEGVLAGSGVAQAPEGAVCADGKEGDAPFQLAAVWSWSGQPERAREAYLRPLERGLRVDNPVAAARAEIGLARLAAEAGEAAEALRLASSASERLMAVRLEVENEDNRLAFFENAQQAFDLTVRLLAENGQGERALEVAEAARAREFHDRAAEVGVGLVGDKDVGPAARLVAIRMRLRELDRRADRATAEQQPELERQRESSLETVAALERALHERRSEATPAVAPATLTVPEMQAQLDPGTLLLVYRLGEEAGFLWEVDRAAVRLHELAPRSTIDRLALAAVDSLARGGEAPDLCRLSQLVLAPVASRLRGGGVRQLVIAADGALQRFPFAALPVAAGDEPCDAATPPLVELLPTVAVPSLSSLARLRLAHAARAPAQQAMLAVGDPVYGPPDPRCATASEAAEAALPRLPASGDEARAACRAFGGVCRTGFEAGLDQVLADEPGRFRTLLFAVHGEVDEAQPLLSSLVFGATDATCPAPPPRLHAYEIASRPLRAELTVLSACGSGLGPEIGGEGLVNGLVQSFLIAGSARVMATLWDVGDARAAELVARVFEVLRGDLPPPEALRQAQLELRRRGMPPAGWAPFVLFGEWRPPPP